MIIKHNNKIVTCNNKWLSKVQIDPYNPLNLPAYTIRAKFVQGYTPSMGDSRTLVDSTNNVWDITKNSTSWSSLFNVYGYTAERSLLEILGANATGVTNMQNLFSSNRVLTNVAIFDTSSVTNMHGMFNGCNGLTAIPDFNVASVIDCGESFYNCSSVETGILDMYNKLSALTLSDYWSCFYNCGSNTTSGAAELAQIPENWKTEY